MGGDFGPSVLVPGALDASRKYDLKVLLVGDRPKVVSVLDTLDTSGADYDLVQADEVVLMNERPADVLRRKKKSSIQIGCRLVKEGQADAVVSAGHSGAAVACGMFIIGRLKGVERPALCTIMPTEKDPVVLLDAGANVDCRPYHLFQFGLMGDAFARDILDYESPRVSILSIGCDGFVGNIVVKMSEGLAKAITHMIKGVFKSSVTGMLGGLLAKRSFAQFARTVDYAEYGGAPLLGLKGLAIVCHGRSSSKAMTSAIRMAGTFVRKKTLDRLAETIQENDELTRYSRAL